MKDRPAVRLADRGETREIASQTPMYLAGLRCSLVRWLALSWGARRRGTRLTDIDGNLCSRQASDLKPWEVCGIRKQDQEAVCSFFVRQTV